MGDLSNNFSRHEFECKCGCGFDTVDSELVSILQNISNNFGNVKVTISSGCRCSEYNSRIKGSVNSQHILGRASDIVVESVSPRVIQGYLLDRYTNKYGIGSYSTFTHIDTRTRGPARWEG